MKKNIIIIFSILTLILMIIFLNKKIIEFYFSYKLSNWIEKDITFDKFYIDYPNIILIENLKIKNDNPVYYDLIFESKEITIKLDLKSFLFSDLVIIDSLIITKPKFYLEVVKKRLQSEKISNDNNEIIYEDNIGIAKKIYENLPDKVWPAKKKDINFLILNSKIYDGIAFIRISSIINESKILLSNFKFAKTGNQKGHQHYKDVLKIMLFDVFGREMDLKKKRILKKIYQF